MWLKFHIVIDSQGSWVCSAYVSGIHICLPLKTYGAQNFAKIKKKGPKILEK